MSIRTTFCLPAVIVLLAVAAAAAQQQVVIESGPPVTGEPIALRGFGGGPMKTGTGRITGRVLSSDTGVPVRRAQVRASGPEVRTKTTLTDAEGRYEFTDLPGGRIAITVSKSGYVSVQYGQTRPFESGRALDLADKQVLDKADVFLPRGGVISGRIVDEFGEPVADAVVSSMRQTWVGGRRRQTPTGRTAQTNDLGQFRLYGLPPGEYFVSATLRNPDGMALETVLAVRGVGGATPPSTPSSGYAPTYFPGTTSASGAQRVTVAAGQEAQNTDFALAPVRLARISGMVLTSDGKAFEGGMVTATPANNPSAVGFAMAMGAAGRSAKDGTFSISGIAPGDYILNVRPMRFTSESGGDRVMFSAQIGGLDGGDTEFAALPVTVGGEDLSNVIVVTSKGASASGRITFEGGTKPTTLSGLRISAAAVDMDGPVVTGGVAITKADGSFEFKGLAGRRVIGVMNLPSGWMLKAVRLDGDEVTDSGIEFRAGQAVSGLEIVATSKLTEVSGSVSGSNGAPIKDCTVVLFADDPQLWAAPLSRWVTGLRSDIEGRFRIRNMPPGSYHIVALEYIEQGSWGDPELLERLKGRARRITIGEGEPARIDLRLTEVY